MSDKLNENGQNAQNNWKNFQNIKSQTQNELWNNFYYTAEEKKQHERLQSIYTVLVHMDGNTKADDFRRTMRKYRVIYKQSSPKIQDLLKWKIEKLLQHKQWFFTFYQLIYSRWIERFMEELAWWDDYKINTDKYKFLNDI